MCGQRIISFEFVSQEGLWRRKDLRVFSILAQLTPFEGVNWAKILNTRKSFRRHGQREYVTMATERFAPWSRAHAAHGYSRRGNFNRSVFRCVLRLKSSCSCSTPPYPFSRWERRGGKMRGPRVVCCCIWQLVISEYYCLCSTVIL